MASRIIKDRVKFVFDDLIQFINNPETISRYPDGLAIVDRTDTEVMFTFGPYKLVLRAILGLLTDVAYLRTYQVVSNPLMYGYFKEEEMPPDTLIAIFSYGERFFKRRTVISAIGIPIELTLIQDFGNQYIKCLYDCLISIEKTTIDTLGIEPIE